MIKRVVVAGCRDYCDYYSVKEFLDAELAEIRKENEIIILSGTCRGTDMLGERYAYENNFEVERHPAQWELFGKNAGPIRNRFMANRADLIICFWDGVSSGTGGIIEYAKSIGKEVKVKMI